MIAHLCKLFRARKWTYKLCWTYFINHESLWYKSFKCFHKFWHFYILWPNILEKQRRQCWL